MSRASPAFAFLVGALGIALFSGMDAVMKGLTLALGVYNAMLWRMGTVMVMSGAVYLTQPRKRPGRAAIRLHIVRGAVTAVMALLFFWGLARVPMAQAIALAFIAPLLALFLAALLLKERVTRAAILASAIAFGGVILIMIGQWQGQLGHEAFLGALAILGSAVCYAWNIILMRQQALVAGPAEVAFFQGVTVTGFLLLGAPWLAAIPESGQWAPIAFAAALATASLFLLSWAYARAEASYLAPTEYTAFLWATLFGFLVFGEVPSLFTVAGAGLIVAGCVMAARHKPGSHTPPDLEAQLP